MGAAVRVTQTAALTRCDHIRLHAAVHAAVMMQMLVFCVLFSAVTTACVIAGS
jgi:hypothetical protein